MSLLCEIGPLIRLPLLITINYNVPRNFREIWHFFKNYAAKFYIFFERNMLFPSNYIPPWLMAEYCHKIVIGNTWTVTGKLRRYRTALEQKTET